MKIGNNARQRLPSFLIMVLLIAFWEVICRLFSLPDYILPSPSNIAGALTENFALLMKHTAATLYAVGIGLLLAIAVAMILALAMNRWESVRNAVYPLLVISQAIPIFALAPLLLIWLGVGLTPKVAVVTLVCFFPLAVNVAEGLKQVNPEALELMRVMQSGSWFTFKSLLLPSVLPHFFSGLKISATYSVMGAIIGEWLGGSIGLGVYMTRMMHSYKTGHLFAAVLIAVLLSLILFRITTMFAWLAMPWSRTKITTTGSEEMC
ncbi:MAG: ABC transporter permease [Firmicutes bacterium]|jgi:ABC-type nitrate/sulfonate/bicarbonate transport system permease component|nr:ABC transporter permease [Bacillota bacterium]